MPTYRIPKITWGTSFANTLNLDYPIHVDSAVSYSRPRDGSDFVQCVSGVEDAWVIGPDYYLECDVKWIPTTNESSATGWDGSTGVRAFLEWARQKNQFRWYPDKNSGTYIASYLVEPMQDAPALMPNGYRSVRLVMRNYTSSYDGY